MENNRILHFIENGQDIFEDTQKQISALNHLLDLSDSGMMSSTDVAIVENMRKDKEFKLKESAVLRTHLNQDGTPRTIAAPSPSNRNRYSTKLPDGRHITCNTYNGLIEKLYIYYAEKCLITLKDHEYTINCVFQQALECYTATNNPSPNTIYKYKHAFRRFFEDTELVSKDIRYISELDLQKFTQEMVTRRHPKKKAFLEYMGILNLTFNYARLQKMIAENPVDFIQSRVYLKSCDQTRPKSKDKILSADEIKQVQEVLWQRILQKHYYINGYMALFAIETGMRAGELCSLKWADVQEKHIHIHTQQLADRINGKNEFRLVNWTKNERGISQNGRLFPLTKEIQRILNDLREKQETLGIQSEYVFAHENGEWVHTIAYEKSLARLCKSLGLEVTNNHAFRMSLNSNVFIPLNIPVTTRAQLLGHSVEVNLKNYSFAEKNNLDSICDLLNIGLVNP